MASINNTPYVVCESRTLILIHMCILRLLLARMRNSIELIPFLYLRDSMLETFAADIDERIKLLKVETERISRFKFNSAHIFCDTSFRLN